MKQSQLSFFSSSEPSNTATSLVSFDSKHPVVRGHFADREALESLLEYALKSVLNYIL